MTSTSPNQAEQHTKRKQIFVPAGFQLRYALLVAGSLSVLLLSTGLHSFYLVKRLLPAEFATPVQAALQASTWRLFAVGGLYVAVVSLAAVFLSHRAFGPVARLEEDLRRLADSKDLTFPLRVREGDELEGLVGALNALIRRAKEKL